MLLKTALRNLFKNPIMNVICLLQLIAVFLITSVMVSAMYIRYITYYPIKDILESKGLYCVYSSICGATRPGGITADLRDSIFSADELREYMKADKVITIQTGTLIHTDSSFETIVSQNTGRPLFYSDDLLKSYTPKLKSGRWVSNDSDELETVIPEGAFGAKIGDTINFILVQETDPQRITMKVVGILEDGAEILGRESSRNITGDTYRFMYSPYIRAVEEGHNPPLLASLSVLNRLYPDAGAMIDSAFFIYEQPSEDDIIQAGRLAAQIGSQVTIPLEDMNNNSIVYLREQLLKLLPIVLVLMILVIVNSISISAIVTRQRLKDYTKYYLLGLQWKQCALVNLLQSLIVGIAALIVTVILMLVINMTSIAETIMITWNFWLLPAFCGILALYLIFSMIMPLIMLGSTTPKEQLQIE